ncbi:hypothetical protein NG827_01460 [Xanthomonas sacchari]|uniref:hypothetical protein n=1 Tax=Xanthomonas sacchari TaxID=56458 RepID=UPI00225AD472|nr:hypothetical protein [Xanthomonas sacchari]UYK85112.1 hypothetical protein NG827_01460 [Xanthomonas sacchari]
MRDDAVLPRCAATSGQARLQRSNVQSLRNPENREKPAVLLDFSPVWENRHSYLDIRNGAATRT